jgi:predicted ArsR family transcriptional regulator
MSPSLVELTADPIRLSLVRSLADRDSVSLSELAKLAGVHPNTARAHVAELERAGALVRAHARRAGRGRPVLLYRLAEGWALPDRGEAELAELLAGLVQRLDPSSNAIDEFGREWGTFMAGRPGTRKGAPGAIAPLERLGFDVELQADDLRLRGCPCPQVSPERPELICRLATAVAEGLLRGAGTRHRIGSRHHDPSRRSCTLRLTAEK